MIFNIGLWERYIRNQFIKQITLFVENVENQLIPTFDNIESEAEKVSEKEWNELCSSCYSPDIDPADLAERAEEAGIDQYMMLSGIKQALLNIAATALFHLFEQQVIFLLRREILHPAEKNDVRLMKLPVFKERLNQKGIDVNHFSWDVIDELRIVANSVKHAEGKSAIDLRKIRPDLFTHPLANDDGMAIGLIPRLYMPLAGEDIYVSIDDLNKYRSALVEFWKSLISAMYKAT